MYGKCNSACGHIEIITISKCSVVEILRSRWKSRKPRTRNNELTAIIFNTSRFVNSMNVDLILPLVSDSPDHYLNF